MKTPQPKLTELHLDLAKAQWNKILADLKISSLEQMSISDIRQVLIKAFIKFKKNILTINELSWICLKLYDLYLNLSINEQYADAKLGSTLNIGMELDYYLRLIPDEPYATNHTFENMYHQLWKYVNKYRH